MAATPAPSALVYAGGDGTSIRWFQAIASEPDPEELVASAPATHLTATETTVFWSDGCEHTQRLIGHTEICIKRN
jgi:hypothetical protein